MNGPPADDCGARRQLCARLLNAEDHCDDSERSLAASWLSGETTRDWTLVGSSGAQPSCSLSKMSRPISTSRSKAVAQLAVLGDAVVGRGDLALLADLFVQLGGVILEEGALSGP